MGAFIVMAEREGLTKNTRSLLFLSLKGHLGALRLAMSKMHPRFVEP